MSVRFVRRVIAVATATVTLSSGLAAATIGSAQASPNTAASSGQGPFQSLNLQVGTFLFLSANNSDLTVADWDNEGIPDVLAVEKSPSFGNRTRLHVLSGDANYTVETASWDTALAPTDETFDFAFADWDHDGLLDLFAIKKSRTGTGHTEVHILSGASGFQQFIDQTGTALEETDATFEFALTDWDHDGRPDLVAIKKSRTGTGHTEVHILSGASNFQQFIDQTGTALEETDATFEFALTDWDHDGRPDLVAIKKSRTGTGHTEVHILSGASNFQQFILQTGTALEETDANTVFALADRDFNGQADLYAFTTSPSGFPPIGIRIFG